MRIGLIGPIGSGKSTLSKLLSEYYEVPLIEEPVENNEFLPLFYEDKETFALLSQNAFYSSLFLLMWKSKHEEACIFDSTLFSNLVFTELLRLEGIMSAYEVALTYAIADEHLKRLPDVDIHLVLVNEEDKLFENVKKRGRDIEKGQREYLEFHYRNYYDVLDRIFKNYQVPEEKILYVKMDDVYVEEEFHRVREIIEEHYKNMPKEFRADISKYKK
jgi:deoxyadenosine/deoxycytidine kinase